MIDASLRPDCTNCAALCCIALAFDRSAHFAFDKPAGEPCRNLTSDNGCTIHAHLADRGFGGCAAYDCHGAGQAATALFGGRTWRSDPDVLAPMMDAFRRLRQIHDLRLLLAAARALSLEEGDLGRLADFERALTPAAGWTAAKLTALDIDALSGAVHAFLRTLRPASVQLVA